MASRLIFTARDADYPDDPPPNFSRDAAGHLFLAFNDSTDESCVFEARAPSNLDVGGDQRFRAISRSETATTGNVVLEIEVEAITPDIDTTDTQTVSTFATAVPETVAAHGTPAGRIGVDTVTLTVLEADSIAAGDWCRFRVRRNANDVADTLIGDYELTGLELDDNA